jgi:hypothetical protein
MSLLREYERMRNTNLFFIMVELMMDFVIIGCLLYAVWKVQLIWRCGMLTEVQMPGYELWWRIFLTAFLLDFVLRFRRAGWKR